MANEFSRSEETNYNLSSAEVDLLAALLQPNDATYPWNPDDPTSEAYFASLEQESVLEGWLEEDITARSQTFFHELDRIWSNTTPINDTEVTSSNPLQATLLLRFASCVPQNWLEAIAHQASTAFSTQKTKIDQMVQCVQELVPSFAEDDLLVLARPFAYAMRGSQTATVEFVVSNLCSRNWTDLSQIEQARLSLAIAGYALNELQQDQ